MSAIYRPWGFWRLLHSGSKSLRYFLGQIWTGPLIDIDIDIYIYNNVLTNQWEKDIYVDIVLFLIFFVYFVLEL